MTLVLVVALVLVALAGSAVVLTAEPERQAITLSVHGLVLSVLFFLMQAPDVALAQVAVGAAVVPLMVMLALRTIRRQR